MSNKNAYKPQLIARITGGKIISYYEDDVNITELLTDSRKLLSTSNSIFIALTSQRDDGHKYIPGLIKKGVRCFLVSQNPPDELLYQAYFIKTNNSLLALQKLAAAHRQQFSYPLAGITGSNGKTIVKEWLSQLLFDKNIVINPKSYNSQIGVPLSVWQMKPQHELAIFEAGISLPGEMDNLEKILNPDIGIFTNVGQAHDENFPSTQKKIEEKLLLFKDSSHLIISSAYPAIIEAFDKNYSHSNCKIFSWGYSYKDDLQIKKISKGKEHTLLDLLYKGHNALVQISFTDDASIENAIHCISFMLLLGYELSDIRHRLRNLAPIEMRLEMKNGINNCTIINDSYSSDLKSLNIALDFLGNQSQKGKRTIILSDIVQSGRPANELYGEIANLLHKKNISRIIGIGKEISSQKNIFPMQKAFWPDTDSFLKNISANDFNNESILIKGARKFRFEKISSVLQQKAHETVLEINLDSISHNLQYFRSLINNGTKIMAMVKAFSYGSGSYEIARILQYYNVDYLAVAYTDEGIELRKAGINLPIMVMNPGPESLEALIRYRLEPEVYSFKILNKLKHTLGNPETREGLPLKIHIKLDTGMKRLGFLAEDIPELTRQLKNQKLLSLASVFTHLAASEDMMQDAFTERQLSTFEYCCNNLKQSLNTNFLMHALNSAGIIRHPQAFFDMVRLGIGLYGVSPIEEIQKQLKNVSSLKSMISQIKQLKKGESLGYGREHIADKDQLIATVPVGYADGIRRNLGNGKGKMWVHKQAAPILGNICMDMCMLDITGIPAEEGDEVIVFGDICPVSTFAAEIETIPYEVLTSISSRVKRVYFQE